MASLQAYSQDDKDELVEVPKHFLYDVAIMYESYQRTGDIDDLHPAQLVTMGEQLGEYLGNDGLD